VPSEYPVIGSIQHTLSRSGGWHHGHPLNSVIATVGRVKFQDFRKNPILRVSPHPSGAAALVRCSSPFEPPLGPAPFVVASSGSMYSPVDPNCGLSPMWDDYQSNTSWVGSMGRTCGCECVLVLVACGPWLLVLA
jgi:hypothetical protein